MSAQLNGRLWTTTAEGIGALAQVDAKYGYGPMRYIVDVRASANNDLSAGGIKGCAITISTHYLPQVGRHYINVNGASGQPLGPPVRNFNFVSANIYGDWLDGTFFSGHAVDGFVDIIEVTDGQVRGTFEFNAPNRTWTAANGQPPVFRVEGGTFLADIIGDGRNMPWDVAQ